MMGGTLTSLVGVIFLYQSPEIKRSVKILLSTQVRLAAMGFTSSSLQVLLVLATMIVTASSVNNLRAKKGLPLVNQFSSWLFLSK